MLLVNHTLFTKIPQCADGMLYTHRALVLKVCVWDDTYSAPQTINILLVLDTSRLIINNSGATILSVHVDSINAFEVSCGDCDYISLTVKLNTLTLNYSSYIFIGGWLVCVAEHTSSPYRIDYSIRPVSKKLKMYP